MMKNLLVWLVLLFVQSALCQSSPERMFNYCDSLFSRGSDLGYFPGLAFAFFSADSSWIRSYGKKEFETTRLVDENTLFQLGSIGKVLTAIAVLQQVESDRLDLNRDIREYLPWLETIGPVTLRDLLTHSAGMNDKNIGYFVKDSSNMKPLEQHLMNNLPSFYQKAGLEINYSNYSYALAGYLVELVSKVPFHEYIKKNVLDRLEMSDSYIGFDFSYLTNTDFALGHRAIDGGFELNSEYARNALPAGSFISNAIDMQSLIISITKRDTAILSAPSWDYLFTRQFSNHTDLTGYSLGLEEQIVGDQTYWAKGGMLPGYLSQIVFLPDGTSMFIALNSNDDAFLEQFHRSLLVKFYGRDSPDAAKIKLPDLSDYAGEYRNARYDRNGVENIISLFRGAFEVWESDSSLLAWHNGEMHEYEFVGNHTFQNKNNADQKMIFVESDGRIEKLYRNVNIGGLSVPSTFEKTRWYNSPTFVNEYYGIVLLGIGLCGILTFFSLLILIFKPRLWRWKILPIKYQIVSLVSVVIVFMHIFLALYPLVRNPLDLLFGPPELFAGFNDLIYVIIGTCLGLWGLLILAYKNSKGRSLSRIALFTLCLLLSIHIWFLNYWSFL